MTHLTMTIDAPATEPPAVLFRSEPRAAIEGVLDDAALGAGGAPWGAGPAAPGGGAVLSLLDATLQRLGL